MRLALIRTGRIGGDHADTLSALPNVESLEDAIQAEWMAEARDLRARA